MRFPQRRMSLVAKQKIIMKENCNQRRRNYNLSDSSFLIDKKKPAKQLLNILLDRS